MPKSARLHWCMASSWWMSEVPPPCKSVQMSLPVAAGRLQHRSWALDGAGDAVFCRAWNMEKTWSSMDLLPIPGIPGVIADEHGLLVELCSIPRRFLWWGWRGGRYLGCRWLSSSQKLHLFKRNLSLILKHLIFHYHEEAIPTGMYIGFANWPNLPWNKVCGNNHSPSTTKGLTQAI